MRTKQPTPEDRPIPTYEHGDVSIHYEEWGSGFPLLLLAPGGMKSAIPFWYSTPWNPIDELSGDYRVIAMDQRNAGQSSAPVSGDDGWHTYIADQLALLDHLSVGRFHVAGMCIGGPYSMGLIEAAPERVASNVLFQSIGLDENRDAFYEMFDTWANELRATSHTTLADDEWTRFRSSMYDGDFLFTVDRDFVRACETPLLVLAGNDLYHPASTSREIGELAPNVEYIESWKESPDREAAMEQTAAFLARHTP